MYEGRRLSSDPTDLEALEEKPAGNIQPSDDLASLSTDSSASLGEKSFKKDVKPARSNRLLQRPTLQRHRTTLSSIVSPPEKQEYDAEAGHDSPGRSMSQLHEMVFVIVLCFTQLITQSQLGSVLVPLQLIGESFENNSVGERSWFCAAYSLTVGCFVLVAGQLGDIHGHKKMLIAGWLWFSLWSLVAGFSVFTKSTIFFDICRALQGIGPAFLLPNGLAILGRVYPPGRRKEMVFALFATTAPAGFVMGAVFGSLFAQLASWPWAFYTTAIVCFLIAFLAYLTIPNPNLAAETPSTDQFDLLGAIYGVAGLVLVNFAWNQAVVVGWSVPYVYAMLILGIIVLAVFQYHERCIAKNPLFPMEVWNASSACIIAAVALGWSSFGAWCFYTYQLIEVLRHVTPLAAAAQFVPEMISGIAAALATGYLLSRVPTRWMMFASSTAFCLGCLFAATAPVEQTFWANIFVSMIIMAWG